MAKRPDKPDSTMPLSESQVVAVTPKPPDHAIPKNDRSVWMGKVVGADEFAPAPKRTKKRWIVITALGIAAGGAGIAGYEMYSGGSGGGGGTGSGSGSVVSGSAVGSGSMVAPAAMTPDAAQPTDAAPPVDAAPPPADAAPADAAPAKATKKKPVRKQKRH